MSREIDILLSPAERARAHHIASPADRTRFALRRAFRRHCGSLALGGQEPLASVLFDETPAGRPYLASRPDLWFSFASCRSGMLGAWSASCRLGVDIEDRSLHVDPSDIADSFFAGSEARTVRAARDTRRARTLLQFWCLKEAALKSLGQGLPLGLDAFVFDLMPRLRMVQAPAGTGGAERFEAYRLASPAACAALVTHDVR